MVKKRLLHRFPRFKRILKPMLMLLAFGLAARVAAVGLASVQAPPQPPEQIFQPSPTKLQPEPVKVEPEAAARKLTEPSRGLIEVLPSEVELPPNREKVTVMLALHNTSSDTFSEIQPFFFKDNSAANVKVDSEPISSEIQRLDPRADLAWKLQLYNDGQDPTSGTIYVEIKYKSQVQGGSQAVPRVAFASFKVKSQDIAELAEVHVNTTLESLEHEHPGRVYIVVTNKSNQSIKVEDILPAGPDFIAFDSYFETRKNQQKDQKKEQELTLSPRQIRAFQIDVKADKKVQSGNHLLVFTIQLEWGDWQKRNLVATQNVKVGVLGESVLLQLLGVPSFLVLPGFLVLVMWGLLWTMGLRKSKFDTGQFPLQFSQQPANPQFWVVAITFSMLILAVYIWFYPDFHRIYGLNDIVLIWLVSAIVLGVGGYLLIANLRIYYLRQQTPSETDEPIDILEKLDRQELGVFLDTVNVNVKPGDTTQTRSALLLQESRDDRVTSWVGPGILVTFKPGTDQQVKDRIAEQIKHKRNARALAMLLKEGLKKKVLEVAWKPLDGSPDAISSPYEVKTADIQITKPDYFVEVT